MTNNTLFRNAKVMHHSNGGSAQLNLIFMRRWYAAKRRNYAASTRSPDAGRAENRITACDKTAAVLVEWITLLQTSWI